MVARLGPGIGEEDEGARDGSRREALEQHPLSVYVDTQGTGKADEEKIAKVLQELMSLTPRGIREHLKLNRAIYERTSAYGHFGRAPEKDGGFSWEKTDLVKDLRSAFGAR